MRNALLAVVLLLAAGCGDATKSFETGFKSSFEKNFAESCTKGAMDGGRVPEERRAAVVQVCACTAKKLVERHGVTELTAMSAGSGQDKVEAAVKECAL
jgi:hypothetical protein